MKTAGEPRSLVVRLQPLTYHRVLSDRNRRFFYMYIFLIVVIAIIGVFLALVILLQSGKGGGLAGIASGGATQQILGTRTAPDILEKATWALATVFIILCILTNFVIDDGDAPDSVIQQQGTQQQLPVIPPADGGAAPADAGGTDAGTQSDPSGDGQ